MTEWLSGIVGEAVAPYASIAIGLLVVFLLIALLFRLLKAVSSGKFGTMHQNRLGIVEAIALEGKRRLVIVRRDDKEHLILIGGQNDLVVEQGFEKAPSQGDPVASAKPQAKPAAQPATQATQPAAQPAAQPQNTQAAQPATQAPATAQAAAPSTKAEAAPAASSATKTIKPVQAPPKNNDSAKVKEMERIVDQIAGD